MHHGKLNIHQQISFSSVSRASYLTMDVVTVDVPVEVDYISRLTSLV